MFADSQEVGTSITPYKNAFLVLLTLLTDLPKQITSVLHDHFFH